MSLEQMLSGNNIRAPTQVPASKLSTEVDDSTSTTRLDFSRKSSPILCCLTTRSVMQYYSALADSIIKNTFHFSEAFTINRPSSVGFYPGIGCNNFDDSLLDTVHGTFVRIPQFCFSETHCESFDSLDPSIPTDSYRKDKPYVVKKWMSKIFGTQIDFIPSSSLPLGLLRYVRYVSVYYTDKTIYMTKRDRIDVFKIIKKFTRSVSANLAKKTSLSSADFYQFARAIVAIGIGVPVAKPRLWLAHDILYATSRALPSHFSVNLSRYNSTCDNRIVLPVNQIILDTDSDCSADVFEKSEVFSKCESIEKVLGNPAGNVVSRLDVHVTISPLIYHEQ